MTGEYIKVPIFTNYAHTDGFGLVGEVTLRKDKIPSHPNWALHLGYKKGEKDSNYEILEFGLVSSQVEGQEE